jgi:hypothetical protein
MTTTLMEPPSAPGLLDIPGCEFTPVSLTLPPDLSYDHWHRIGRQLQLADLALQWWIGDWLKFGEAKYGEKYTQALEETGRKKQTLMNYVYVARAIEVSRRRESVDFSTHAEVAGLDEEDQERILGKAAKEGTTRRGVRREAERARRAKMPKREANALLLCKSARSFLDDYMVELALWPDKIPSGISQAEREAIEQMIYEHGNQAMWLRDRTAAAETKAVTELFSFKEGTPGMVSAAGSHVQKWLTTCGYHMNEADINDRLNLMAGESKLEIRTTEGARKVGQRGTMNDLYALDPDYENSLDEDDGE